MFKTKMEMEKPFAKINNKSRIDCEMKMYQRLMQKPVTITPLVYGTRSCRNNIRKKKLYMQPMVCSLHDYGQYEESDVETDEIDEPDEPNWPREWSKKKRHVHSEYQSCTPIVDISDFWQRAYQLCLLVAILHETAEMCHRDIKPQNVCVDECGMLRLIDMEACVVIPHRRPKRMHHLLKRRLEYQEWQEMLGTRSYAAPEMIKGRCCDRRCDTWSLGVTLLEMYAGVDLNSKYVEEIDMTQQELDALVVKLVSCRSDAYYNSGVSRKLITRLLHSCLVLDYKKRPYARDIAKHCSFMAVLTPEQQAETHEYYTGLTSLDANHKIDY